jgi:hypothetical protein
MDDQEPMSEFEMRQAREWREKWNGLRYLLLALRKLGTWILGVGVALSVWWDLIKSLTGGGTHK